MPTITDLERVAAAHWRGTEEEWLGGWLLRAGGGFTGRANSALPLGDPGLPLDDALAVVTRWYRDRGLPPMIAVPAPLDTAAPAAPDAAAASAARGTSGTPNASAALGASGPPNASAVSAALGASATSDATAAAGAPAASGAPVASSEAGVPPAAGPPGVAVPPREADGTGRVLDEHLALRSWPVRSGPAFVMVADLPLAMAAVIRADRFVGGRAVQISTEPDDAWAARYHYRGQDQLPPIARQVLTSAREQSFVSIRDGDEVLAIARLSIADGWAGLTAVEVHPGHRRQGLGVMITAASCAVAEQRGISHVFLQVEVGNAPAQALYKRLGFRYAHRYHYRVAPEA